MASLLPRVHEGQLCEYKSGYCWLINTDPHVGGSCFSDLHILWKELIYMASWRWRKTDWKESKAVFNFIYLCSLNMVKTLFEMLSVTQNTPEYQDSRYIDEVVMQLFRTHLKRLLTMTVSMDSSLGSWSTKRAQRSIKPTWPWPDGRVTPCDCARHCIHHRLSKASLTRSLGGSNLWPGVLQEELVLHARRAGRVTEFDKCLQQSILFLRTCEKILSTLALLWGRPSMCWTSVNWRPNRGSPSALLINDTSLVLA